MPVISEMYAFIVQDTSPDDEGVIGFRDPSNGDWMPLVGADMQRAESLRPIAESVARDLGKNVVLAKFSVRENIEVIGGNDDKG